MPKNRTGGKKEKAERLGYVMTLRCNRSQLSELSEICKNDGISRQEAIRIAIEHILERKISLKKESQC
jgi:hypothetical protein